MAVLDDFIIRYDILKIEHVSGTTVYTVNALYTAVLQAFDDFGGMDDLIPMAAQTPSEYTLINGWFIDDISITYLSGGAIDTVSHARVQDSNAGIVHVSRTGSNIVVEDIGTAIIHADGDTGVLLDINGGNDLVIRPTNSTSTHNWDSAAGDITCNGHTDVQNGASNTGETTWSNIYSLGTIASNTDIYIVQDGAKIAAWWPFGHIDVLIEIRHIGVLTDFGLLTVYARQYTKLYDHFEVDASLGGRIPIPLSTSADVNNNNITSTGYRQFTGTGGTGTFNVGNYIYVGASWAAATKKGVLTAVSGYTLTYYLIGDLTDFTSGNAVVEWTGTANDATCTAGIPANAGVATLSGITFTFGADTKNLSNGNGLRPYDVVINCNGNTLANFYEYTKYITRRGSTTSLNGYNGEQYITTGSIRLSYDGQTVNFLEGATLTGQLSGATGVIVADHDDVTTGTLILRDVRGTFQDDENIQDNQGTPGNAYIILTGGINATLLSKTAPFGTFAGVKFFGASGVFIYNMHADDANNYTLIDAEGTPQDPPASVSVVVNGLVSGDSVAVFRATDANGTIDKTYLTLTAGNNSGNTTLVVNETIPSDTPASGVVRIIDNDDNTSTKDRRYSYTSISAPSTFNGIVKLFGALDAGLDRNYTITADTAYVPYIDTTATGTSASMSVIYNEVRYITTRVRKKGILPFITNTTQLTSIGYTATAVRTTDSIVD